VVQRVAAGNSPECPWPPISASKNPASNLERALHTRRILLDEKAIFSVLDSLRKDDFYLEGHRKIYEKMSELSTGQHR